MPPRWAEPLAAATGSEHRVTLTSRNWMRPLTGVIAARRPHLVGSWEGGANLILVRRGRPGGAISEHRKAVLARIPERRVVSMVRLQGGLCVANLHASTGAGRAGRDVLRAAALAGEWAGESPLVLGGDFNLRPGVRPAGAAPPPFDELESGFGLSGVTGDDAIDHILARGAERLGPPEAWPPSRRDVPAGDSGLMIRLSDHAPVVTKISA